MEDQVTIENDVQQLPAIDDEFGGVVVEMNRHMDCDVFRRLLKTSMSHWTLQGKKGVWIKLPIELSNLVDAAVKEGFWYHHAEPKYLMLLYWIPQTVNPIPGNASHIARVGAIVINDKREILVVQEKMGILRGLWKISTGIIHEGEDISVGVVREVKEETGIDTEFVEVLAFRYDNIPVEVEDNKWKKENDNGSEAQLTFYSDRNWSPISLKPLQRFTLITRKACQLYMSLSG